MSIIKVNDTELELDILDADVAERFENLMARLAEDIQEKSQYQGLSASEGMKRQCEIVDRFFDELFGAGTAGRIFGAGNHHLGQRLEAFAQVCQVKDAIRNAANGILEKYGVQTPGNPPALTVTPGGGRHPGGRRPPGRGKRKGGKK